jgi:predicted ATPase
MRAIVGHACGDASAAGLRGPGMAGRRRSSKGGGECEVFVRRLALDTESGPLPAGHPFGLPAIRHLGEREFTAPVTVFVGENGMGKSTLLEALAVVVGFNAEGGGRNFRFATRATHSALHERLRVVRGPRRPRDGYFLRAESYYNVATEIDQLDEHPDNRNAGPPIIAAYGGTSLHRQSHGESFFALFLHRFGGQGLYLLDEPESALSPQRQLALLARMHELVQAGSQFVLATHAPILMAYPGADVWQFGPDGIARVAAADTDHWRVLRGFLGDPDRVLRELLGGA